MKGFSRTSNPEFKSRSSEVSDPELDLRDLTQNSLGIAKRIKHYVHALIFKNNVRTNYHFAQVNHRLDAFEKEVKDKLDALTLCNDIQGIGVHSSILELFDKAREEVKRLSTQENPETTAEFERLRQKLLEERNTNIETVGKEVATYIFQSIDSARNHFNEAGKDLSKNRISSSIRHLFLTGLALLIPTAIGLGVYYGITANIKAKDTSTRLTSTKGKLEQELAQTNSATFQKFSAIEQRLTDLTSTQTQIISVQGKYSQEFNDYKQEQEKQLRDSQNQIKSLTETITTNSIAMQKQFTELTKNYETKFEEQKYQIYEQEQTISALGAKLNSSNATILTLEERLNSIEKEKSSPANLTLRVDYK